MPINYLYELIWSTWGCCCCQKIKDQPMLLVLKTICLIAMHYLFKWGNYTVMNINITSCKTSTLLTIYLAYHCTLKHLRQGTWTLQPGCDNRYKLVFTFFTVGYLMAVMHKGLDCWLRGQKKPPILASKHGFSEVSLCLFVYVYCISHVWLLLQGTWLGISVI